MAKRDNTKDEPEEEKYPLFPGLKSFKYVLIVLLAVGLFRAVDIFIRYNS